MSDVSLLFNFLKGRDTAGPAMSEKGDQLAAMNAKSALSAGFLANKMVLLGTVIAASAGEAVALVDALAPMAGLLAALPAVAFAGATSIGALLLGFSGLAAAMKSTAGGAGPSADAIISAQHAVAQAQIQATQASKDLAAARESEMKADRDLALQLQEANLSLAEAQLNVRDAQKALTQAQQQGDPLAIAHAQLALQEANLNVQEATNKASDTQEEYNKRQAQGVGNSDQVQQALQRQADATYQVGAAQRALVQTQSGGAGASAAAAAYAKLSPAAKQVVDALKSLAPAWRDVTQATSQAELAGVVADIRRLGAEYLPMLKSALAAVGAGWNTAFRQTAGLVGSAGFVKDFNTSLTNTAAFAQQAGKALAPIVDGLRQFGVVGSTFLPRLGGWIHNIAVEFDHWATAARDSGKIQAWISNGIVAAQKFGLVLADVSRAFVDIFKAGNAGPGFLDTIVAGSAAFAQWAASVKGQGQLKEFFSSLRDVFAGLFSIVKELSSAFIQTGPGISTIAGYLTVTGAVVKVLADNMNLLRPILPFIIDAFVVWKALTAAMTVQQWLLDAALDANPIGLIIIGVGLLVAAFLILWNKSAAFRDFWIVTWAIIKTAFWDYVTAWKLGITAIVTGFNATVTWFEKLPARLAIIGTNMFNALIKNPFRLAINWLIHAWDSLHFSLPTINLGPLGSVPGFNIGVPQIPYLATGGYVIQSGLAVIHKGETVTPAKAVHAVTAPPVAPVSRFSPGAGGDSQVIDVLMKLLRKGIKDRGGNVQIALGGAR